MKKSLGNLPYTLPAKDTGKANDWRASATGSVAASFTKINKERAVLIRQVLFFLPQPSLSSGPCDPTFCMPYTYTLDYLSTFIPYQNIQRELKTWSSHGTELEYFSCGNVCGS